MLRSRLLGLLFVFACMQAAAQDIAVPPGFVLQSLDPTDGQIARPRDWYYASSGTPSGWTWTVSRENPDNGPYQTGLRIQMLLGIEARSGFTRPAFVQHFVDTKRDGNQVLRNCPVVRDGDFYRRCLEVIEKIGIGGKDREFHVLYSLSWSTTMDMVVVTVFGAPPQDWEALRPTVDTMAAFRLIGPRFGQDEMAGPPSDATPTPAGFDTVYNHITPESEARGGDTKIKALYADRYRFVDVRPRPGFESAKVTGGSLPHNAFAQDGTPIAGKGEMAFVVSPDGRAVEPRFVAISDERLRATMLAAVATWRFAPATLDGTPVATLASQDFSFEEPTP